MRKIILKGITWAHSRGFTPLVAYAQRFGELYPEVEVIWEKRTLQQFADFPVEKLAERYDLLIIDHPWVGCAAATECVLPLEEYLPKEFLDDQLQNSVGGSHLSYNYNGHQWALAIDAAVPAASYRADLFEKNGREIPATWEDVITLAEEGKVAVPAVPIDLLMNFFTFCIANGKAPFLTRAEVINEATGVSALKAMKELYSRVDKKMLGFNPIAVAEMMTITDDYWYCPFAYCYSNYSRSGFARNILTYTNPVNFKNTGKLRGTIGGTGLAVSAFSKNKERALLFAREIVSSECQSTFYVEHGGQPGHKGAWKSENANRLCNNFFKNILPSMENGYGRPRYNGYLMFQANAGKPLQEYLMGNIKAGEVLKEMNDLYKKSYLLNLIVN
jgi:multiple sugar transport system substrate-binding protein